ncbi:putative Gdt1 family protein [Helianthus annuus]|uniref:GDT1 family protein n=1 Tax=Helianthus annuus TaxID=4232 RepID=A0A251RL62_HELAN|nr:protein PAM71, chloroplastic isoform X2 [Helianthus annuus]KAF5753385.1 putative Gdt1 family protein [Helianthus annuus]KAJ0427482.1 putative Gdt1 family protein [Helianthus annuus]KAJ0445761.1 putative Gdt1 family protein [Helianthus annuus]KAJ0824224.1 putative Gdt1 family protein [Helianthus annuus]
MRSMTTLCSSESILLTRRSQPAKQFRSFVDSTVFSRQHRIKLHDTRFRQVRLSRTHMNVLQSDGDDATKLPHNTDHRECSTSEKLYSTNKPTPITPLLFRNLSTDASWNTYLKFMLFFGILTFQDAENALASSDAASVMQFSSFFGDLDDLSTGFASAFLLIFFSELGDKTFFIAALLAARNSAAVVFLGTFGALGVMTVISVVLGRTFHYVDEILPFRFGDMDLPIDDIAAALLLVYFGVSTLLDASSDDGLKAEEEQKEAEIAVSEVSGDGAGILAAASTIISTFLLVFVAEWGDKSFFSTIALAAASSPLGVIGGALAGHGLATLLAVLGGSLLGTFLSEKVIAYVGGVLFLVFAAVTVVEIVS